MGEDRGGRCTKERVWSKFLSLIQWKEEILKGTKQDKFDHKFICFHCKYYVFLHSAIINGTTEFNFTISSVFQHNDRD